jgi:hypothetical protein
VYYCVLTLVNFLQGVELVFNGLSGNRPTEMKIYKGGPEVEE